MRCIEKNGIGKKTRKCGSMKNRFFSVLSTVLFISLLFNDLYPPPISPCSGDQSHRGRLPAAGSGELPGAAAPADVGLLAEGAQRAA